MAHHKLLKHISKSGPFMLLLIFYSIGASADEPIFSRFIESLTANPLLIGILVSISWLTFTVVSEPAGSIIDRIGTRKAILLGGILDVFGFLIVYLANSIYIFAAAMILSGIGSAFFWTASRTHTANLFRKKTGTAFGQYVASWGFGWAVGPLVGGSLAFFLGIRIPFLFAAVILALAILALWKIVPADKKKKHTEKTLSYELRGGFLRDGLNFLKCAPLNVKKIFFLQMLQYAVLETILIFAPLYFIKINNAELGIIFFAQSAIFAVSSIFCGTQADKSSKRLFITAGFLASVCLSLLFLNAANFIPVLVLFSIFGLAMALIEPISDAMLNDCVNHKMRGVANGFSQAAYGIGGGVGPLIGGAVASAFGIQGTFMLAALLCLAGIAVGFSIKNR